MIPDWNDSVEEYFKNALFWHDVWVENGRPNEGELYNIRKKTRSDYHKVMYESY